MRPMVVNLPNSFRMAVRVGGFDVNRLLNTTAVWSIIIFWLWMFFYWILQYIPMPLALSVPDSKDNAYPYTNIVIGQIKTVMCPSSVGGSPISYCVWYFPTFICFTIVALLNRVKKFRPHC